MKSTDSHRNHSGICKPCGDYRDRCNERAYKQWKRELEGETIPCFHCDTTGYVQGIKCPRCEGKGETPMKIGSMDYALSNGYLKRFLPSDY